MTVRTARSTLAPITLAMVDAALAGNATLQAAVGVQVPDSWPPEFLDADAWAWLRHRMAEPAYVAGWWMYVAVYQHVAGDHRLGTVGYEGPPDADATVEIGIGTVHERRLKGYASEMAGALVARAFATSPVRRVIAETMPELVGAIGVPRRCRFTQVDGAAEPGAIRFELTRESFEIRVSRALIAARRHLYFSRGQLPVPRFKRPLY